MPAAYSMVIIIVIIIIIIIIIRIIILSLTILIIKASTLQDEKLALAVATKVYLHRLSVVWNNQPSMPADHSIVIIIIIIIIIILLLLLTIIIIKASTLQDEKLALAVATKVYLHRLSVVWTSPLSDANRVKTTNQFALPVLTYPMWMQHFPLAELREIDRETRKLVTENGGKHPLSSTAVFYLPRVAGGRGMKSIEHEYKVIKIKAAIKLYMNPDPMMRSARVFEERAAERGCASLVKDAHRYEEE